MRNLIYLLAVLALCLVTTVIAQKGKHKIEVQFTKANDTMQQKAFTKLLQNVLEHWPTAQIEAVCYNNGIDYILSAKSKHTKAIADLKSKGVQFMACPNTMNQRNIKPEDLLPEVEIVPAGIAEIVEKQEKGWSYIKGGF